MGLIALILSVVLDLVRPRDGRGRPRPLAGSAAAAVRDPAAAAELRRHPTTPLAAWLLRRLASSDDGVPTTLVTAGPGAHAVAPALGWIGWLLFVGLPVVVVGLLEATFGAALGVLALAIHVAVLYAMVGLGPFQRAFAELRLLIGAGEFESARDALRRWEGEGLPVGPAGASEAFSDTVGDEHAQTEGGELERAASAHALMVAFRDVFAPLFWYLLLPGAVGAVLYVFARQAAVRTDGPAAVAYRWLDWLPLRVAALVFALVGKFEETVVAMRTVGRVVATPERSDDRGGSEAMGGLQAPWTRGDAYGHQRLFLLPVTGSALGCVLNDAATEATLRHGAPDYDGPVDGAPAGALASLASLLMRSGAIALGLYLLVKLLA